MDLSRKEIVKLKLFVEDDHIDQTGEIIDFSYFHDQK